MNNLTKADVRTSTLSDAKERQSEYRIVDLNDYSLLLDATHLPSVKSTNRTIAIDVTTIPYVKPLDIATEGH
jgi:hypothetical protein